MVQKTAEFDKAQADLDSKEQRQFRLQSQRDDCINHIEQIQTRTDVNEQKFKENQHTIAETVQTRREQQITKQRYQEQVIASEQRFNRISEQLQQRSKQIGKKELAYNEQKSAYGKLDVRLGQYRTMQERLKPDLDQINNNWISKRMWMSSATRNLTELRVSMCRKYEKLIEKSLKRGTLTH